MELNGDELHARSWLTKIATGPSDLGGGPDGTLHGGRGLLDFVASIRGLKAAEVPSTAKDGTEVSTDIAARPRVFARPNFKSMKHPHGSAEGCWSSRTSAQDPEGLAHGHFLMAGRFSFLSKSFDRPGGPAVADGGWGSSRAVENR